MEKELQKYLDSCAQPHGEDGLSSFEKYRVVRLLGFSDFEETQLVHRVEPRKSGIGARPGAADIQSDEVSAEGGACSPDANSVVCETPSASSAFQEEGPFVREIIDARASGGQVYEMLFAAQQDGVEFQHIPRIIECDHEGESLVVVTEYVEGSSLESTVNAFGPSPQLARQMFPSLCDAVIELHELMERPVIHRDLKPSNIMLSDSQVVLIDFGISRVFKEGASRDTRQFGTRSYAPPEQFGFGQTSVRSDVYALGMVLYFCLTGCQPPSSIADASRPKEIPVPLWDVIVTATRFDPEQRFSTVAALKAAAMWAFDASDGASEADLPERSLFVDKPSLPVSSAPLPDEPRVSLEDVRRSSDFSSPSSAFGRPHSAVRQSGEAQPKRPLWQRVLLKTWNVFLLCATGLLWIGLFASIVHPDVPEAPGQALVRALEGAGLIALPVSLVAYGLADLRESERLPLARRPWLSRLGLMAKAAFVVFLVAALFSYAITPVA